MRFSLSYPKCYLQLTFVCYLQLKVWETLSAVFQYNFKLFYR
jgi:hypothetical protein